MSQKTVYATVARSNGQPTRLGAVMDHEGGCVMVHVVRGPRLGGFFLSRFEGGVLTSGTLKTLFEGKVA